MKSNNKSKNIMVLIKRLNNTFKPETVFTNNKAKMHWYSNKLKFYLKVFRYYNRKIDAKIYKQVGGVLIDQNKK